MTSVVRAQFRPTIFLFVGTSGANICTHLLTLGFVERRSGKGSHLRLVHPKSGKEVWVTVHGHDAGRLGNRILRDAGVE